MLSGPKRGSVIKNKRNKKKKAYQCLELLPLLLLPPSPFRSVEWLGGWAKWSVCGCCGHHHGSRLVIEVVEVIVIAKTKNK